MWACERIPSNCIYFPQHTQRRAWSSHDRMSVRTSPCEGNVRYRTFLVPQTIYRVTAAGNAVSPVRDGFSAFTAVLAVLSPIPRHFGYHQTPMSRALGLGYGRLFGVSITQSTPTMRHNSTRDSNISDHWYATRHVLCHPTRPPPPPPQIILCRERCR